MKTIKGLAALCLLSLFVLGATCNPSQQRITHNTLASLETSTVALYDGYIQAVIRGKVSTNDLPKVSAAFNAFQVSMQTAINIARNDTNAAPSPLVINAASNVTYTITAAKEIH